MNVFAAADQLRALASRVRRNMPRNSDPERFHEEVSEIAHEIVALAEQMVASDPLGRVERNVVRPVPGFKGRIVVTSQIIAGRRVTVQRRRMPFAIHEGD